MCPEKSGRQTTLGENQPYIDPTLPRHIVLATQDSHQKA